MSGTGAEEAPIGTGAVEAPVEEIVPAALAGERLDRVVAFVVDVSRAQATTMIERGGVSVGGTPARSGKVRLREGDAVTIDPGTIPRAEPPSADAGVDVTVVHADEHLVVVDKPADLVVHPGAGHPAGTLVNGLLARFPELADVGDPMRPGIVHRLDAGSSGLLAVARTSDAFANLVEQFSSRTAGRTYDALVWGHPAAPHGIVDAPIGRDPRDPVRMAVVADGRPARTEYEVVERFGSPAPLARLTCRLQTGRTHQIRVHLASIGHPLVADPVYGERRPVLGLTRPFLHAAHLELDHPATGERVRFDAPLPDDLAEMLAGLEPLVED